MSEAKASPSRSSKPENESSATESSTRQSSSNTRQSSSNNSAESNTFSGVPISDTYSDLVKSLQRNTAETSKQSNSGASRPILGLKTKAKGANKGSSKSSNEATSDRASKQKDSAAGQPSVIVDVDIAEYVKPTSRAGQNEKSSGPDSTVGKDAKSAIDFDLDHHASMQDAESLKSASALAASLDLSQSVQLNGIDVELAEAWQETFEEASQEISESSDKKTAVENEQELVAKATAEMVESARAKAARAEVTQALKQRSDAIRQEANRAAAVSLEAQRDAQARTNRALKSKENHDRAQQAEAKRAEAMRTEAKRANAKSAEIKRAEQQRVAAKQAEAKQAEARRVAAKEAEEKRAETMRAAAKRAEVMQAEAKLVAAAKKAEAKHAEAKRAATERDNAKSDQTKRSETERAAAELTKTSVVRRAKQATSAEIERLNTENVVSRIDSVKKSKDKQGFPRNAEILIHPTASSKSTVTTPNLAEEVDVVWLDDTSEITSVDIVLPPNTGQSLREDEGWVDDTSAWDETSSAPLVLDDDDYLNQSMEYMAAIRQEDFDDTAGFNIPAASYASNKDRLGWFARTVMAIEKALDIFVKRPVSKLFSQRFRRK